MKMIPHFKRQLQIKLYKIVIVGLFVASGALGYAYWTTQDQKVAAVWSGLLTGLLVALIQYLLSWNEHREVEAIKELGIIQILPHRDDRLHYQSLIQKGKIKILLLGNTASRFFEDFAHRQRSDAGALIEALQRGACMRVLLPTLENLDSTDKARAEQARVRMKELQRQFPKKLLFREFSQPPAHSILLVDEECLVGPVFPHVKSKDSPTIHAYASSPLVQEYLKHFEKLWHDAVAPPT